MKTWTFRRVPESANRLLRSHWGRRRGEARRWRRLVVAICGRRTPPVSVPVALMIRIHRYRPQDPDNAYASCKHLIDALVRAGWLRDDASEWLRLLVEELATANRAEQRTEVHWVELEPSPTEREEIEIHGPGRRRTRRDRGTAGTGHRVRCAGSSSRAPRHKPARHAGEDRERRDRDGGQVEEVRCGSRERPSNDAPPR